MQLQQVIDFWKSGIFGKIVLLGGVVGMFCCLCVGLGSVLPSAPTPTPDVAAMQTDAINTAFAKMTADAPTNTLLPTDTPAPTDTPLPTATSTPLPEPIVLTGTGDNIVDFEKWDGPAILRIKYTGGGNFAVKNYAPGSSDPTDLMVNTIGSYTGVQPLDIYVGQQTARFEIIASGPWELRIDPFDTIRTENIPGVIQGTGDDFLKIVGGTPDLLKIDASQAAHNFAIFAQSDSDRDLVVNEIAPYTGTVLVNGDTSYLIITATGPWSIEVTTR